MFLGFLVSVSNGLSFSNQVGVKVRMGKLLRSDGLVGGRFRTELLNGCGTARGENHSSQMVLLFMGMYGNRDCQW